MTVARYYSSTAVQTQISAQITASDTVMTVADVTGYPVSYPYTLILDLGTDSEEIVEVTAAAGTTLTITRGIDSTTPLTHSVGATVVHGVSARDHREAQQHIAATDGVHGLAPASSVVGTTDTQTLANKTLSSPTITNASISAPSVTSGSWSGGTFTTATVDGPTISTPTITNGSWSTGSLSGATLTTATLTAPTIADFTNADHDHSTAAKGGNVPQGSVTGLSTRLTNIESKNTTQDNTLTSQDTRISALEAQIFDHGTVNVSFASDTQFTLSVTFNKTFTAAPAVTTNIGTGTAVASHWDSRAEGVSTTGFTLFVFSPNGGAAQTWSNIPVQWIAVGS